MSAKNKHDIMDELLKGSSEEAAQEDSALAKLIHRTGETLSDTHPVASSSDPEQKKTSVSDSKKKSTHYLSEEIFDDLDDARDKINEIVHQRLKSRISKSRIVNQALRMILKDFEEKGEKSHLIKEILKESQKK
ncbi:MAG: hypothetical protein OEV89_05950 [Desulfobulbaceae bacterium]|nr:hypothetical protein [Desulfobulbaceae bacterium]HIJ90295.1 hypothetical protein [Deltaproteobacteria bacterium]